jgi:hypothetical protein
VTKIVKKYNLAINILRVVGKIFDGILYPLFSVYSVWWGGKGSSNKTSKISIPNDKMGSFTILLESVLSMLELRVYLKERGIGRISEGLLKEKRKINNVYFSF